MMSAWGEIREIYQKTNKPDDFLFNQWICRPPAAVLVYFLKNRRITPNQITFLSLFAAIGACLMLVLWRTYWGGVVAAGLLWLAFVFDCTDGQLSRIRGTSSPIGAMLDFLMDAFKAVGLTAAVVVRVGWMYWERNEPQWAVWSFTLGLVGTAVVSCGISLTTLMRRPEYLQAAYPALGKAAIAEQATAEVPEPRSLPLRPGLARVIKAIEWVGRTLINYPSWIWIPALLGRYEWFFLVYASAHTLHLGRSGLTLLWRLGRFEPKPMAPQEPSQ